jgi:hypothetical protein
VFVCMHSLLTAYCLVCMLHYVVTVYYMIVMLLWCGTNYVIVKLPDRFGKCFEVKC